MNEYNNLMWLDNRSKMLISELSELEREICELEGTIVGKKQYREYLRQEIESIKKGMNKRNE